MVVILAGVLTTIVVASRTPSLEITSTRDLAKYVGTYPCTNGLLKQPVLLSSLKQILRGDYEAYREQMKFSGCGAIERRDGFLLMDVSQMHVGGYTSLIFVRLRDGALFLFWLKSTVAQKEYSFYGQKPIPAPVSKIVESELNATWGHVAQFHVHGENVRIELVPAPK
jgi:hypothetical protein